MSDIPVECCRCRNKHMESERVCKPNGKFKALTELVCPKCGARSYYNLRPVIAWCFASGQIEFGPPGSQPDGAIVIASGPQSWLKAKVEVAARRSYSGKPLVPGVPEAEDQQDAGNALSIWLKWCARDNGRRNRHGVTFHTEENPYVVS